MTCISLLERIFQAYAVSHGYMENIISRLQRKSQCGLSNRVANIIHCSAIRHIRSQDYDCLCNVPNIECSPLGQASYPFQ